MSLKLQVTPKLVGASCTSAAIVAFIILGARQLAQLHAPRFLSLVVGFTKGLMLNSLMIPTVLGFVLLAC
jgi:hypothetical protein